jgi:predicted transcriptional regulator
MTEEAAEGGENMTLLRLSADIVSAYVRNNSLPSA